MSLDCLLEAAKIVEQRESKGRYFYFIVYYLGVLVSTTSFFSVT